MLASPLSSVTDVLGQIVRETLVSAQRPGSPALDDDLHEWGLTSLNMVNLMIAVEARFDFLIPTSELHPDNFRSLRSIAALVLRLNPQPASLLIES